MQNPKQTHVEKFTVSTGDETYECRRVVTGTDRRCEQMVEVAGIGSKPDSAIYGDGWHPVDSMESTARLIAHEIIGTSLRAPTS